MVPVLALHLTFHGLGAIPAGVDAGERPYWLEAAAFAALVDGAQAATRAAGLGLGLHFDDGYRSDLDIALPALAARGLQATFHVLAGRIGRPGSLSGSDLRALVAAGMTIGCHGHDHVDWRRLDDAGLRCELVEARQRIEDAAGVAVRQAAAPFGAFDRRVTRAARAAGFAALATSAGGLAVDGAFLVARSSPRADWDMAGRIAALTSTRARLTAAPRALARRMKWGG